MHNAGRTSFVRLDRGNLLIAYDWGSSSPAGAD